MSARVPDRAAPGMVVVGGLLFAGGNLLHPLEHGDAAEGHPAWALAHITFAVGALLVAAGLPRAVDAVLPRGGAVSAGTAALWLAMVLMPVGAYAEVVVAPRTSDAVMHNLDEAALPFVGLQTVLLLVGPLLLGGTALRRRAWHAGAASMLVVAPVLLVASPGLPGPDGAWVIVATTLLGVGLSVLGAAARRSGTGAGRSLPRPDLSSTVGT